MKNIIAFGASNSKQSINKQLATFAANSIKNASVTVLDLNDFSVPVYGIDAENENGIPSNAQAFFDKIQEADAIVISFAEHNGNFTSAFKNLYDWMSRIAQKLWAQKPMLLLATSPGARGGASVLNIAKNGFPYMGANVVADFSLPSFYDNFKNGIIENETLANDLSAAVTALEKAM
ncbi:MAG: NADPH-dependent FMN reductase [Tenacibaculum sp.]